MRHEKAKEIFDMIMDEMGNNEDAIDGVAEFMALINALYTNVFLNFHANGNFDLEDARGFMDKIKSVTLDSLIEEGME